MRPTRFLLLTLFGMAGTGAVVLLIVNAYPMQVSRLWRVPGVQQAQVVLTVVLVLFLLCVSVAIMIDWRASKRRYLARRGLCVHCGYSLTGNTSGVCPECGTAV